jgi:predicted  nucleic acid-binding Zn-ribbon protein
MVNDNWGVILREINDNISGLKSEVTAMREDFIRLETRIGVRGSGGLIDDVTRLENQMEENIKKLEIEVEKLKGQVEIIKQKIWKWAGGLALAVFLSGFIGLLVSIFGSK